MGFSNRFDTSEKQDYIHNYTPLPFEAIGNLGAKMTQEHAAKQAEADALADQLNKIKVSNQVLSEGSGEDLGIKYRNTGYGDFKNQVLNKYTLANKQLADDYQAGKLDANQFAQKVGQLKSDFNGDYQKLKIAEVNSAAIEEADKKYREAKQAGASPFILNKLAEEGSRLLSNPYGNEYKGAPIGEALDVEDVKNKYADKFKSQILSSGAGVKDPKTGYITWRDKSGVTKQRVIDSVNSTFENDLIGAQTKEQTWRFLRDRGLDWNSEVTLQNDSKVKAGDYYYNSLKQDFINGVVAKAESSEQKTDRKKDWIFAEERDAETKKQDFLNNPLDLLHPAVQTPQDLNKNNPYSELFSFDANGNPVITPHNDGTMTEKYTYVTQGGETHEGIRTKPGINDKLITKKVFAANEYYASIGKLDEMKKQFTKNGKLDALAMAEQGLKDIAQNYKSGNLNSLAIAVFPEAVQNQMTNYILPKSSFDSDGNPKVINSGMISGMTILDANGNNIPESEDNKIAMLTNASVIGPSYVHPDALRVSLPDGSEVLLKTNSANLANANSEITRFVQESSKAMTAPKSHAQQVYDDKLEAEQNKAIINKLQNSKDPLDKYKLSLIESKLKPLNILKNQGYVQSTSTTLPNGDEVFVYTKYSTNGKPVDQKAIIMNPGATNIRETTVSNAAAEAYSYTFKVPAYNANVQNKAAKDVETFDSTEEDQ